MVLDKHLAAARATDLQSRSSVSDLQIFSLGCSLQNQSAEANASDGLFVC